MERKIYYALDMLTKSSPTYWHERRRKIVEETLDLLKPLRYDPQRILVMQSEEGNRVVLCVYHSLHYEAYHPHHGVYKRERVHGAETTMCLRVFGRQIQVRDEIKDAWDALVSLVEQWQIPETIVRGRAGRTWSFMVWNDDEKIIYSDGRKVYKGDEIYAARFTSASAKALFNTAAEIAKEAGPIRALNECLIEELQQALRPRVIAESI